MSADQADLQRLSDRPGLHGAHCTECDYLFDTYETPSRMNDVIMLLENICCPQCCERQSIVLLMPLTYRKMVEKQIAKEAERERVRLVADKYIERR